MRQYRENSWDTGKRALLLSLGWLWETPRKTKLVSVLGQVPCSRIRNSFPTESIAYRILKFLPWNSKSSFAWSYLASPALCVIICSQEPLISPVSSSSRPPWEQSHSFPPRYPVQAEPLSWACPFPPLCQAQSNPSVIVQLKSFPDQSSFSPYSSV